MAKTMKAVDIKGGAGPASALFINPDTPLPTPKENEALIKVHAFGLNRADLLQREGKYPLPPQAPKTMGLEFSGTIVSFGNQETSTHHNFKTNDPVLALTYGGAYAEYVCVPIPMLIPKPASLSFIEAAGIPEVWMTATQALYLVGGFSAGKSVLFHAGASGVSLAGIQLAVAGGASAVYVTAGTDEKVAFCCSSGEEGGGVGATKGWNYRTTPDWDQQILSHTHNAGVDIIIDFIGGTYFQRNINVAARDACIVLLGMLGGPKTQSEIDIGAFLWKRLRVEGSTLRSRDVEYQKRLRDEVVERAMGKLETGNFKVHVERVFGMEEIKRAHELLEGNGTSGKVVCQVVRE